MRLWLPEGHVGSQSMAGAIGPGLPGGHFDSQAMAGAVVLGLPSAMLVPRAWRDLWSRGCCRPFWFPGHGGSCGVRAAGDHVGFRVMAAAVGLGLPPAMLVPGAWRELCDPGQPGGHVSSQVMAGAVGFGLPQAMFVPGSWQEL